MSLWSRLANTSRDDRFADAIEQDRDPAGAQRGLVPRPSGKVSISGGAGFSLRATSVAPARKRAEARRRLKPAPQRYRSSGGGTRSRAATARRIAQHSHVTWLDSLRWSPIA